MATDHVKRVILVFGGELTSDAKKVWSCIDSSLETLLFFYPGYDCGGVPGRRACCRYHRTWTGTFFLSVSYRFRSTSCWLPWKRRTSSNNMVSKSDNSRESKRAIPSLATLEHSEVRCSVSSERVKPPESMLPTALLIPNWHVCFGVLSMSMSVDSYRYVLYQSTVAKDNCFSIASCQLQPKSGWTLWNGI